MDILTGLNRAMEYIEENICNDVDIDAVVLLLRVLLGFMFRV